MFSDNFRNSYNLCDINFANKNIHFPKNFDAIEKSRNRIIFEELFLLQLALMTLKNNSLGVKKENIYQDVSFEKFSSLLPFELTNAQKRVINEITKDCKISYGATHTAKKGTKIATIQIGYADGLSRACSNKYSVYIGNTKCKIVGNICMDMCMIDITDIEKNVNIGDEVTIFKNQSDIQEIADLTNTINYEIISRLNERIERILI